MISKIFRTIRTLFSTLICFFNDPFEYSACEINVISSIYERCQERLNPWRVLLLLVYVNLYIRLIKKGRKRKPPDRNVARKRKKNDHRAI